MVNRLIQGLDKGLDMNRNTRKRVIRRKAFNALIRFKGKLSRGLLSYFQGLFDQDKNGYFVK